MGQVNKPPADFSRETLSLNHDSTDFYHNVFRSKQVEKYFLTKEGEINVTHITKRFTIE